MSPPFGNKDSELKWQSRGQRDASCSVIFNADNGPPILLTNLFRSGGWCLVVISHGVEVPEPPTQVTVVYSQVFLESPGLL